MASSGVPCPKLYNLKLTSVERQHMVAAGSLATGDVAEEVQKLKNAMRLVITQEQLASTKRFHLGTRTESLLRMMEPKYEFMLGLASQRHSPTIKHTDYSTRAKKNVAALSERLVEMLPLDTKAACLALKGLYKRYLAAIPSTNLDESIVAFRNMLERIDVKVGNCGLNREAIVSAFSNVKSTGKKVKEAFVEVLKLLRYTNVTADLLADLLDTIPIEPVDFHDPMRILGAEVDQMETTPKFCVACARPECGWALPVPTSHKSCRPG